MKAFIFDVDDTLYDQVQPFQSACVKLFGKADGRIDRIFVASRKYSDEVFEASVSGQMTMEEMYIYRTKKAFAEFDISVSDADALQFQRYYEASQMDIALSAEIRRLFDRLKGYATLGVITNGPAAHQWDKVNALELTEWIPQENIVVSGEVNATKPGREIFEIAVRKMGLDVKETYFVGDSIVNDIGGAANAGWNTIWFNRRGKEKGSLVEPDYTVYSERELYEVMVGIADDRI